MSSTSHPMFRALAACIRANVPALVWGEPGEGKTAKLGASAAAWHRHLETVIGSVREATDFLGLPIEVDGTVQYAPLAWAHRLASAPSGLLYLGEFSTSAPSVQKAMLRVVQERWVGDQQLPDSVAIVADANPTASAVDGWDLAAPVANRFIHIDWHFDVQEWLRGVVVGFHNIPVAGLDTDLTTDVTSRRLVVASSITAFLRHRPTLVKPGPPSDPAQAGKAWCSPRSWTNAIEALSHLRPDDDEAAWIVLQGAVGEAATTEYVAWAATADLIDPRAAMNDPSSVDWAGARVDQLFALAHGVAAHSLVSGTRSDWDAAMGVLVAMDAHGKPDVAVNAAQVLFGQNGRLREGLRAEHRAAFGDLLERMGALTPAGASA